MLTGRILRRSLSACVSYNQVEKFCDGFARYAPQPVQRWAEATVEFPIGVELRRSPVLMIRIPKTASTSFAQIVYNGNHQQHRTALFYRNADPVWYASRLTFAVVRDPIRRAISACNFLLDEGRTTPLNAQTARSLRGIRTADDLARDILWPAHEAGRLHELDPVLREQFTYVSCGDDVIVDHILKLEDPARNEGLLRQFGFTASLPRLNASRSSGPVGPRAIEIFERVYERDMRRFGYRRPEAPSP